jgi:acetyltransferase-like isoleucine patch superfamily enzyme
MAGSREQYDKMIAGEPHLQPDPYLRELAALGRRRLKAFNDTPVEDHPARMAALSELFGRPADCMIVSPFMVDYGIHVRIGRSFVNMGCSFLDSNIITIGDRVLIGSGVQLLAAGHPVEAADRFVPWPDDPALPFRGVGIAKPITIEDSCWIGSGAIVLGGVTIGRCTTVGAGSVVTRSLPPFVVAAGNPCRVIRQLEPREVVLPGPRGPA